MEKNINPKVSEWLGDMTNLINVLANASYGSSWFNFGVLKGTYETYLTPRERETLVCREPKWASVLLNGGSIEVYDVEEEEPHTLDFNMLLVGASKLMEEHPQVMQRLLDEEDDFYDNDAIIQYSIFGEWVYG